MSTFTALRSAITSKLGTVSELQEVHDFHTMNFSGYPAATFEPLSNDNVAETSSENKREHVFQIFLHQEIEHAGRDKAAEILSDVLDAVVTAFEEDYNLGGACDFCMPIETTAPISYTGGDGATLAIEVIIRCISETQVLV